MTERKKLIGKIGELRQNVESNQQQLRELVAAIADFLLCEELKRSKKK